MESGGTGDGTGLKALEGLENLTPETIEAAQEAQDTARLDTLGISAKPGAEGTLPGFDPSGSVSATGEEAATLEQLVDINQIRDLADLSEAQFAELAPLLDAEKKRRAEAEAAAGGLAAQGQQLAAGELSPEQLARLDEIAKRSIDVGTSDINAQLTRSLETLREEAGASRGLRFTDTPIFDVAQDVTVDANRQATNLISGVRSEQRQAELSLPFQLAGLTLEQQNVQNQLAQQAFQNRLLLTGQTSDLGLNIAGQTIGPAEYLLGLKGIDASKVKEPSTKDKLLNAALTGGAIYLGGLSDETVKHDITKYDESNVLEKLNELEIHTWRYNEEEGLGTDLHVGPMAQEFQRVFGVGDGKTISLVDVMGVMLASQKALAKEHLNG